jgi:hypothetical protein
MVNFALALIDLLSWEEWAAVVSVISTSWSRTTKPQLFSANWTMNHTHSIMKSVYELLAKSLDGIT